MKNRLGHIFQNLSLGWKFSLIVSGVVLMMGIVSLLFVESIMTQALHIEHTERGLTIARTIGADAVDLLLTDNRIKLHQLLVNRKTTEKDIEYLFVLDAQKQIFSHTFDDKGFPKVLLTANPISPGSQSSDIHMQFDNSINIIHDLAVPALGGKGEEIHVGLSERFIQEKIQALELTLAGITSLVCLVGIFVTLFFARIINKPLISLAIAADQFGQGKPVPHLPVTGRDEIGRLTAIFNQTVKRIEGAKEKQKEVETDLRLSKKNWQRTFNSLTDIVTLQTPDKRIVKINASGCRTLGISEKAITGQHCYQLFHGSDEPCKDCPLLKTQETFSPYTKEMYHKKLARTFLVSASPIIDEKGLLTHIVHVATDVTAIKESEEDRARLAAAIEQASETVVITDTTGNIQYVNPAFEQLTGYSREEAINQNPRILKSGKHDRSFYEKMWLALNRGETWQGNLINKKKDGSLFEEDATITPVRDKNGLVTNFVAVKRDVSREVSLEKQLRQSMKLEAIGTLAGGIAHDFNNILAIMLGLSEIVKDELDVNDPIREDISQIITAGERAADLVKQILTFSRQGDEELKLVTPQLIIKEVLKLLRSSLPSTLQLKENIDPACGKILADPTQIHQVLMNLCTNAKDAIGDNTGTLSVSLSEIRVNVSNPIVNCPQMIHGTYLDLEISDTGCGMDRLTLANIFDPFFTTKEVGKGTGLGLAVVHGIIRQHKGEITVASEPGQGTTFHIYLPVIKDKMQAELAGKKDIPGGNEKILLVDDEPVIAQMLERQLQRLGYTVTVFNSSRDALSAYEKKPGNFDLLLTDMTMPEMTGIDLVQKAVKLRPDLPVILCTGYSESIDEIRAKPLGVSEYVTKPVDRRTLAEAIRRALLAVP